jgi:hypothetical protein
MFDLITIYDDEESSEVPLVTAVKITKEAKPKSVSASGPYSSSALDVESLNTPGIPMDSSRDEPGLGEQGE